MDDDRLIFCRLELDSSGNGFCSTVFVQNPAQLYLVKKWTLEEFAINIELQRVDKETEPIYLKGLAGRSQLLLDMGGLGAKWKRHLRLFNEQEMTAKNTLAKGRIERYKKGNKQ